MEPNVHGQQPFALALNIQRPWITKYVKVDEPNKKKELRNK